MDSTLLAVLIIVIIAVIVIIVIYSNGNKTSIVLSTQKSGTTATTVTASTLPINNTSSNYAYSIWFYVTNWQYRLTEPKILLTRADGTNFNPQITLAPYENNINIGVSTYPTNAAATAAATAAASAAPAAAPVAAPVAPAATAAPVAPVAPVAAPVAPPVAAAEIAPVSSLSVSGFQNQDAGDEHNCLIRNFPIQKWVNLIISLNGRAMDVYLDGKLVRTCLLPGVAIANPAADVKITPDGGFAGWTSNLQYFANTLNPQEAYDIYKKGYNAGGIGGVFNKYKVKVSYLVNDAEANSFEFWVL